MKQSTGNEDKSNSILRVWKERGGAGILALDGMCGALRVFSRRRQAALSYIWMTTICHSPGVQKTGEK